jgi:hypothetical protein
MRRVRTRSSVARRKRLAAAAVRMPTTNRLAITTPSGRTTTLSIRVNAKTAVTIQK